MCGFAGWFARGGTPITAALARRTSDALAHRGPDDLGFFALASDGTYRTSREPSVVDGSQLALVHRRLAILDLSPLGAQPMADPSGCYHLVFNGEIYNYRELREELRAEGHTFVSESDTEVLLQLLIKAGEAALPRLCGMFAFAFVDRARRHLWLARDPFGIKPLYIASGARGLAFGSEIRPLLDLAGLPARVDPQRAYHYLRFGLTDHGAATLYSGVAQLPPGHLQVIEWDRQGLVRSDRPRAWWQLPRGERSDLGFEAAAEEWRGLFLESVRLHLRSDVPVGTALSGGLDSASIVAAMREVGGPALELHAVSYAADDPRLNEERFVSAASTAAGARVHWVRPVPSDLVRDLDALIEVQAEPFGSTSIYAQYRVFQSAREAGLKVMLDGQGADEMLAGYRLYLPARLAGLLRQRRLPEARALWRAAARLPGVARGEMLRLLAHHLLPTPMHGLLRGLAGRELVSAWLDRRWFAEREVGLNSPLRPTRRRDALHEALELALTETSLPMLLRYEDRNSMAHSIESRVPFLTPALVEFALTLPERFLLDDGATSKALLRRAMRGLVPDEILERRDKIGFATPEQRWLVELTPWVEAILASEAAHRIPALNLPALGQEWQRLARGAGRFDWHLWRCLNLIRWTEVAEVSWS